MNNNNENYGVLQTGIIVDFKALFMEVLDKLDMILFLGLFFGLLTYLACSTVISLNYESETKIYIMPQENSNQSSYMDLEVGSLLTTDYIELIQGRDVVEKTINYFNLDMTYEQFLRKVTINNPTDTRIIELSVKDKDQYMARSMAIFLRDISIEAIKNGMGIDGITIWEEANLPLQPILPANTCAAIVMLILCFVATAVVIAHYLIIDKIVSADDIESRLNLTVLGTIGMDSPKKRGRRTSNERSRRNRRNEG